MFSSFLSVTTIGVILLYPLAVMGIAAKPVKAEASPVVVGDANPTTEPTPEPCSPPFCNRREKK